MKCPNCQTMNPPGAKFCVECGKGFDIQCPKCGTITPAGGKFCMSCGHSLQRITEPELIDYSQPQTYTPKFLAEKILTSRSSIEGERKLVTVFFADVANFTALSEKLDPEEVHQLMDGTFKILMENIHRFEGTINQFTGDGVMALFGAPVAHEDHAQRACHAALAIQSALKDYGDDFKKKYGIDFAMRIGLNSGPVVVGSIGDDLRMDYTAIGNTTNLASRMETLAKPGSVLVSTATHRLVRDFFQLESIGLVDIKGLEKPQEAYQLIKTGDVGTRIGASVAKGLTRFVGRKNTMGILMDVYDEVLTGSGQLVGLVGEAGVGKSRLLLEFVNLLAQDEFIYLEGRCLHYGGTMSYLPVLDIIRSYFEIQNSDSDAAVKAKLAAKIDALNSNLRPSLAPLEELLGLKSKDEDFTDLDPQQKRERTFEAIRDLFLRISQDNPLIIAVEDLHWIDKTSEDFLDYLIGWLANSKIMLLLLYRQEYTHQWGNKSYYTQIGLTQLRTPSSIKLLEAILEGNEIAPEIRELILARAAGNPLFIEEFTRTLLDNGTIKCEGHCYILSREAAQMDVPDTIQGLITSRIDRLEENIKRTMQVASVIGRDFAYRILQSITGLQDELKAYLLNLQGLEFIYEKCLFPELEYIFKHALIQEVTYYSLLTARRKELHRKVGRAMEQHFADRLNEYSNIIGEHFLRAEDWERAFVYLNMAGDNAIRLYALAEAKTHFNKAIKALDHLGDGEKHRRLRVDTIIKLTISSWLADSAEALLRRLDEAEKLVESLSENGRKSDEDTLRLARVHFWIGRAHYQRGDMREALAYYKQVLPVAQQTGDQELLAIPSGAIGQALGVQGHLERGAALMAQAIKLFEKTSRWPEWIQTKSFYGSAIVGMGEYQKGLAEVQDALTKATDFQSFTGIAVSQNCLGFAHFFAGDRQRAVEAARAAVEASKRSGDLIYLYVGYALWAWAAALNGQLQVANEQISRSQQVAQKLGGKVIMGDVFQAARAEIALLGGKLDSAIQIAGQIIETAKPLGSIWSVGVSYRVWGQALAKSSTPAWDQAEARLAESLAVLESGQNRLEAARTHLAWGEICRDRGNTATALNHWEEANRQFSASNATQEMQRVQKMIASH
ncbi:MAG: AAA family ATPase [Desulfobacterales bacterium]|nr:MAG: AAA family ATPase [Desulfobacterales bacterium]